MYQALAAVPPGTRVWVAAGFTDMRKGFNGLSAIAQLGPQADPYRAAMCSCSVASAVI
jgi:transposase